MNNLNCKPGIIRFSVAQMSEVQTRLFMECVECHKEFDLFFFNEDKCTFCADGKQTARSKVNYYSRISEQGGRVIGEYKNVWTGILCLCDKQHFCEPKPTDIQRGKDMCKTCSENKPIPIGTPKERFHAKVAELGGQIVGKYVNCGTRVTCRCSEGHSCEVMPKYIQQGRKMCDTCVKDDPNKPRRQFIDRIKELGGKVLGEYVNAEIRVRCICKNSHNCNPLPSHIEQGRKMCPTCRSNSSIKSEQKFRDRIKEFGGKVIGEYIHEKKRIKCLCVQQHNCYPTPKGIKAGTRMCRICEGNTPGTAEKKFRDRIKELGGKVIGKYIRSADPILCECPKGHLHRVIPSNVQRGGMCRTCAGRDPAAAKQNFYDSVKELGGEVLGEYVDSHTLVKCRCVKGHISGTYPGNVQRGRGICSLCVLKSESLCRSIFEELLGIDFLKKRPKWLTWRDRPLELDGYNEEAKIAFEYQGEQHEKYIPHFHRNGPNDFELQLEKDKFKIRRCKEQGVLLFVIPSIISYTDPEAMDTFILEKLEEHGLI